MNDIDLLVDNVISKALDEIASKGMNGQIVTVALYFDHESPALSVCADTLDNSVRHVAESLSWSFHRMAAALEAGDLGRAGLFNSSVGRSLSLGDFSLVNLARTELAIADHRETEEAFFVSLAKGLHRNTTKCFEVCDHHKQIQFACSTATDEVGLFWSPTSDTS